MHGTSRISRIFYVRGMDATGRIFPPHFKGVSFCFYHSSEIKLSFFKAPQSSVFNHIMAFPLKAWAWLQGLGSKTKPWLSISTHNLYNSWSAVRDEILYHPQIRLPHCQTLTLKEKYPSSIGHDLQHYTGLGLYQISSVTSLISRFSPPSLISVCLLPFMRAY